MSVKRIIILLIFCFAVRNVGAQGCVINNYNNFNRVFNVPSAFGSRTFLPGNGNNFVRWEGVCGPHTYVETLGNSNGSCQVTENSVTRTGVYYPTVSMPFTRTCQVPLDDYLIVILILICPVAFYYFRKTQVTFG